MQRLQQLALPPSLPPGYCLRCVRLLESPKLIINAVHSRRFHASRHQRQQTHSTTSSSSPTAATSAAPLPSSPSSHRSLASQYHSSRQTASTPTPPEPSPAQSLSSFSSPQPWQAAHAASTTNGPSRLASLASPSLSLLRQQEQQRGAAQPEKPVVSARSASQASYYKASPTSHSSSPSPVPSPFANAPTFAEAMLKVSLVRERFEKARAAASRTSSSSRLRFSEEMRELLKATPRDEELRRRSQRGRGRGDPARKHDEMRELQRDDLGDTAVGPRSQLPRSGAGTEWAPMKVEAVPEAQDGRWQVEIMHRQSVGRLAGQMQVRGADVLAKLADLGHRSKKLTDFVDATVAELIVSDFGMIGVRVDDRVRPQSGGERSVRRGPVVCVMGHVDHGKTTLLDTLRNAQQRRALFEAGNITQSIGAFVVDLAEPTPSPSPSAASAAAPDLAGVDRARSLATFLDTPGHAAFRAMRERGARSSCTDLIVLVVSAVEGVQPQTVEVIELSKQYSVPMIIAINKCDLAGADPQRVREQLCMYDVVVEQMGGDILAVDISAKLGSGIGQLKECVLLASDMLDLHAPATGPANAYVIESRRERNQGCVVNVVVRAGELRVGDYFVCGLQSGAIRALVDENGKKVDAATPSMAVQLLGASALEDMTEELVTVKTDAEAAAMVRSRAQLVDTVEMDTGADREQQEAAVVPNPADVYRIKAGRSKRTRVGVRPLTEDEKKAEAAKAANTLPLLVKADVMGSLEALLDYVHKLPSDEVTVVVLRSGVGEINEADVHYAELMKAMVVGFNVPISSAATTLARQRGVTVLSRDVIYFVMDEIRDAASKKLATRTELRTVGTAKVQQLFEQTKKKTDETAPVVAGVKVTDGELRHNAIFRVRREGSGVVYEGSLASLKVLSKAAQRVEAGKECGLMLQRWHEVQVGDVIECLAEQQLQLVLDDSAARGFETVHNPKYDLDSAQRQDIVQRKKRQAQELKGASTITYAPASVRAKLKTTSGTP